jgi:hypothetical protein
MDALGWLAALVTGFSVLFVPPVVLDLMFGWVDGDKPSSTVWRNLLWALGWTCGLVPALWWDSRGASGPLPLVAVAVFALFAAFYRLRRDEGGWLNRLLWAALESALVTAAFLAATAAGTAVLS